MGTPTCAPQGNCGNGNRNACTGGGDTWFPNPDGVGTCEATLPVELLHFTTSLIDGKTKLEWTTGSEINNDKFEIYRSGNGIEWELLTTVSGAGNSVETINYKVYDNNPPIGVVSYYILKQVDFDGTYAYSPIKWVFNGDTNSPSIVPNPNNGNFTINFRQQLKEDVSILIRDQHGRIVYSTSFLKGNFTQSISMNLEFNLSAGIYYVEGRNNASVFRQKMVLSY